MIKYHLSIAANLNDSRSEIHTDELLCISQSHGYYTFRPKDTLHCKRKITPTVLEILNYAAWLDCLDSTACLSVINTRQLWNFQVVESVVDVHKHFWISSFLFSQMVLFENRKQNLEPYGLRYFSLDFLYGPLCQRGILFLLCKNPWLQSPNLGTSKICKNIAQFSRKAGDSAYSAKHHAESAEGGLRVFRFFAGELKLIMSYRAHVAQDNQNLQMADGFGLQKSRSQNSGPAYYWSIPEPWLWYQKWSLLWILLVTAAEPKASTELTWTPISLCFTPRDLILFLKYHLPVSPAVSQVLFGTFEVWADYIYIIYIFFLM